MISVNVQAQNQKKDTITYLETINRQYHTERDFINNLYYNPASMSDYSNFSFSELYINSQTNKDQINRYPLGKDQTSFGLKTKSYQTLKKNVSLWGEAAYSSISTKDVKWNENLDYDRISPYSVADSVGGKLDVEKYYFKGGFAKKLNRISYGLEGNYIAQMGARSKDPRNKTVTSNLEVKAGLNFNFYKNLEAGIFIQGEKYTQNNNVRFASILGYPTVNQMAGFGNYNYLFSGGNNNISSIYEQFGYTYGGQISNNNDFYLMAKKSKHDLLKTTNGTQTNYFDIADLIEENSLFEGAKFFTINNNRLGIKAQYKYRKKIGTEYGYSNNTKVIELIYKQKSYKKDITNYSAALFYQYNSRKVNVTLMPFTNYEQFVEKRIGPFNGQKWNSILIGLKTDLRYQINEQHVLSVKPVFSYKKVTNKDAIFSEDYKQSIKDLVLSEHNYLSSNISEFGATIRYDFELKNFPKLFISADYFNTTILEQNNQFLSFNIGVIF